MKPLADEHTNLDDAHKLAARLGTLLTAKQHSLALAESCTGGWIAAEIVGIVGSSAWFDRGFVAYSYASKRDTLGLSETLLDTHGSVSEAAVRAMAAAALYLSTADTSIAVSGVAGPGGGSLAKPVGLVWMAWATRGSTPHAQSFQFSGDRTQIRSQSVRTALHHALAHLSGH